MYSTLEPIECGDLAPLKNLFFQGSIIADSRKIQSGDVFIAYQGEYVDGRDYVAQAIAKGAMAVIYEAGDDFQVIDYGATMLPWLDLKHQAGIVANKLLGNDKIKLKVIGVTGTNGKTSITQWLAQALDLLGEKCAIQGSAGNGFWGALQKSTHTTPDAVTVQNLLHQYAQQQANYLAMEVSSHGLDQARVNGVSFDTVVFTNLTRDHLDYHQTMENYFQAKRKLFYWQQLRHAVINIDDAYGQRLVAELSLNCAELKLTTYGFSQQAAVRIIDCQFSIAGMQLSIQSSWGEVTFHSQLIGQFNALNLAACIAVLCGLGYSLNQVVEVLSKIKAAKGRMESVLRPDKPLVIIDYAHTPDALKNTLLALHPLRQKNGKIWCVFGCGGDRDKGKRPEMGKIAASFADYTVLTSDNPRSENPEQIIEDILPVTNLIKKEVLREQAIKYAIEQAKNTDIVLIAGKGHEDYQEILGVKHHFDDLETVVKFLEP